MCVLSGRPHWLAVYPTVLAGGFLAAALGIGMAVGLFSLVGPRRTRLISQILATFIGAIFLLGLQALSVVPPEVRQGWIGAVEAARSGDAMSAAGAFWLPVHAAMGHGPALIQWVSFALAAFALAASTLGPKFAISVVLSSSGGASGPARVAAQGRTPLRFRTSLGTSIRFKEWRLLMRDPWLSSQLALQVVYTLPVAVVLMRNQGPDGNVAMAIAPALVVIASQLSASLAWLAVSGEEAREFLETAPVSQTVQQRRKLEAIAMPIAAILALPLLGIALVSPVIAAVTMVFCGCAALSTALLNLWHPITGRRQDIMRRHSQSKLIGIMEHLFSLLWVLTMMMVLFGSKVALLPAAIALGLLACNKRWSAMTMEAALRSATPRLGPPGQLRHA